MNRAVVQAIRFFSFVEASFSWLFPLCWAYVPYNLFLCLSKILAFYTCSLMRYNVTKMMHITRILCGNSKVLLQVWRHWQNHTMLCTVQFLSVCVYKGIFCFKGACSITLNEGCVRESNSGYSIKNKEFYYASWCHCTVCINMTVHQVLLMWVHQDIQWVVHLMLCILLSFVSVCVCACVCVCVCVCVLMIITCKHAPTLYTVSLLQH